MVDHSATKHAVFICHASEDKEALVRPLAECLRRDGVRVWYDEFSLEWGDSLRRTIDHGLATSRFGIVVLSKAFFSKQWPQYELDGLANREIDTGQTVILPIWHEIDKADVASHSPTLAGRVALQSDAGVEALAHRVHERLNRVDRDAVHGEAVLRAATRESEFEGLINPVALTGPLDDAMRFTSSDALSVFMRVTLYRFLDQDAPDAACHFFCDVDSSTRVSIEVQHRRKDGVAVLFAEVTGERPSDNWRPFHEIHESSFGGSSVNENGPAVQTWWREWIQSSNTRGELDSVAQVFCRALSSSRPWPLELFAGLMPTRD